MKTEKYRDQKILGVALIPFLLVAMILMLALFLWSGKFGQEKPLETSIRPPSQKGEKLSLWATDSAVLKLESDLNILKANSEFIDLEETRLTFPPLDFKTSFDEAK